MFKNFHMEITVLNRVQDPFELEALCGYTAHTLRLVKTDR